MSTTGANRASGRASRRDFLKQTAAAAAGAAAVGALRLQRSAHAAGSGTIKIGLIGCGGRGSGAAVNAMNAGKDVRLVAMADVFEQYLQGARQRLKKLKPDQVEVPDDHCFVGFDAYQKLIQSGVDVVLIAAASHFHPVHLKAAVDAGKHVFCEKPHGVDVPGLKIAMAAGEEAKKKNLKIMAGLQCRHSVNRHELIKRIRDGQLGEIMLVRAYRVHPAGGGLGKKPDNMTDLMWQIRNFTAFQWVSGGLYAEMNIHQIDELFWLKGDWPAIARGFGGRKANSADRSQGFDSLSIEWTFPDGAKGTDGVRWLGGHCFSEFATFVHGTKCAAQFSGNVHAPTVQIHKDQRISRDNIAWRPDAEKVSPYQAEWDALLDAIRNDKPYNEVQRAAYTNLASIMGRAAIHTGQIVTWEQMMASNFKFCPDVNFTLRSPAPVQADAEGRYPVPIPGQWSEV